MAATGAALVLSLAACGGGGQGSGSDGGKNKDGAKGNVAKADTRDPRTVLKAAALKTAQQNSYLTKNTTRTEKGEIRAEVSFSRKPELQRKKLWGPPNENPKLDSFNDMISDDKAIYTKNAGLAGGKWLKSDSKPEDGQEKRAEGYLPLLLGALATAKDLTKVGDETVGGRATSHVKGSVVISELAQYKGDAVEGWLRDLYVKGKEGVDKADIDLWIGADDLVVKAQEHGKGTKEHTTTEEYSDYGADPRITVPSGDDVITFDEFLRDAANQGAGRKG
ncbi:hypothetical protein [Streptomyces sp. NPDC002537]